MSPSSGTLAVMENHFDEGEHIKEVYANFGLAIYLGQVLEHGIVNALVYTDLVPRRTGHIGSKEQWEAEFDAFMGRHFEGTLGTLIKTLQRHVAVPASVEASLKEALKLRNFLVHGYFRERAMDLASFKGRVKMLAELEEAHKVLQRADQELESVARPYREKVGFTDERLQDAYNQMLREAGINR